MPGKNFIKVASVLLIISAVLALIVYPLAGLLFGYATVATGEKMGIVFVVVCLLYTVASVLELIAGIKGIKGCNLKEAASGLKKWGWIVLIIAVVAAVVNFVNAIMRGDPIISAAAGIFIGFIVPGLYIHGVSKNEKA